MKSKFITLFNIKPGEVVLVRQLLTLQFFLGIATAILSTSSLTIFLSTFESSQFPKVLLIAAGVLFITNYAYAWLEARFNAKKLLQVIILFSAVSIALTWVGAKFFDYSWLPFFEAAWNMVVYMLVGYAFWGMAAIMFNVRESKRLFAVVGSGDIPAKILGYAVVGILGPFIGVVNLFLVSVSAFLIAYYFLKILQHQAITSGHDTGSHQHGVSQVQSTGHTKQDSLFSKVFQNRFIFSIALWSFVGYLIFLLIDFTFLANIKSLHNSVPALAAFIGFFFALGRVLAIFFKLLFSSRVISRLGLVNTLLITPFVLLLLTIVVLLNSSNTATHLYLFGVMMLLSEVLKSAVQEPAFFILFQPLQPHDRLKGHLITKGFTMPFALLGVGLFVYTIMEPNGHVPILFICQTLVLLLAVSIAAVFLIKKEYYQTLINALKKGFFTGSALFLQDEPVRRLLLEKTESNNPKEIVLALQLLERSKYTKIVDVLVQNLKSPYQIVQKYVLERVVQRRLKEVYPIVFEMFQKASFSDLKPGLVKAIYALVPVLTEEQKNAFWQLNNNLKKAALVGLAERKDPEAVKFVETTLLELVSSTVVANRLLALDTMAIVSVDTHTDVLGYLLTDTEGVVSRKAMDVIAINHNLNLLEKVVQTAVDRKDYVALEKTLIQYGDDVFAESSILNNLVPVNARHYLIRAAASLKGQNSTDYLLALLDSDDQVKTMLVEGLWAKKAQIKQGEHLKLVESWLEQKLQQSKLKVDYYLTLYPRTEAKLLVKALKSELDEDIQILLKSFALLYDRERINRVIELFKRKEFVKKSNAIELLELLIPKRYFVQMDVVLEFLQDVHTGQLLRAAKDTTSLNQILTEILTVNPAGCSTWTKSVTFYILPQFSQVPHGLLQDAVVEEEPLVQETYRHVLSLLK